MKRPPLLLPVLLLAAGCAVDPWQRYDTSLYTLFREATPAARKAHLAVLRGVVEGAAERGAKAPPGVAAEYGWYLARAGRMEEGRRYLEQEARDYPEAVPFVRVLSALSAGRRPLEGAGGEGER